MSSRSELEAACHLEALKELLRERRVTYARLAAELGCSLPTVKRALNKPSLPFSRLLEFCEVAGIPFSDLHQRAERRRPRHFVFTNQQDELFARRPEILEYFLELAREGATPSGVARRHALDRRSTSLYLQHLIRVGLVEQRGRRFFVRARPPFGFGPGSRVLRRENERFLKAVVAQVLAGDPNGEGCAAVLKLLALSRKDYERMIAELENVIDRFAAIAERGLGSDSPSNWQVAIACGPAPEKAVRRLPRIER